ncbi:MAG TPA: hypothetical protein VF794_14315 [Archangium sp.]|jgi:hypothetical protein|uniref:hypothetical protein n=1 Tax=Archangium sp. TaxID=1872627 RepID=UPI002EDA3333
MPQFSRSLDIYQGFNFKKDKQSPVGFVTKLTLGGELDLAADQGSIKDPVLPGQDMEESVVGVLSHYLWETGTTDAMYLSMQVSVKNKTTLSAKLLNDWTSMDVTFGYVIYEYDPVKKKYFKSNWTEPELEGILEKNGDQLNLTVADDPSTEVQSPKNFTLQIGIKPQTKEQTVNMATGDGYNLTKIWGITEESA